MSRRAPRSGAGATTCSWEPTIPDIDLVDDWVRPPSAGAWHTCWLHGSHSDRVSCKGDNDFGQSHWRDQPLDDIALPDIEADDFTLVCTSDLIPNPDDIDIPLKVGDVFRLLFITSTARDGTSEDIATYNRFVRDHARNGHPDIRRFAYAFAAVASTDDIDAHDNVAINVDSDDDYRHQDAPVYWLSGKEVVSRSDGLFDGTGTWTNEGAQAAADENGDTYFPDGGKVYTGTVSDGTGSHNTLGRNPVSIGVLDGNNPLGPYSGESVQNTVMFPFYGLSPPITIIEDPNTPRC